LAICPRTASSLAISVSIEARPDTTNRSAWYCWLRCSTLRQREITDALVELPELLHPQSTLARRTEKEATEAFAPTPPLDHRHAER